MSGWRRCATNLAILVPPPRRKRLLSAPAARPPITANPARSELRRRLGRCRLPVVLAVRSAAAGVESVLLFPRLLRPSICLERDAFFSLMRILPPAPVLTYVCLAFAA